MRLCLSTLEQPKPYRETALHRPRIFYIKLVVVLPFHQHANSKVMVSTKSDQQSWTISPPDREQTPPPQFPAPPAFTEEDDGTNSMQQVEHAFPKVGELPIPHLSPLTAHVHPFSTLSR